MTRLKRVYIRLVHWEYWSFHWVYAPIYFYWFWLCFKSRSLFFFSAANPGIRNGGFLMESKKEIYDLMPDHLYPATLYNNPGKPFGDIEKELSERLFHFPVIVKPDIGLRGIGVALLKNSDELKQYHAHVKVPYLLQPYIDYPEEAGIFYCRMPGSNRGSITSITGKEFLKVTGDGRRNIQQLLEREHRFALQIAALKATYGNKLNEILPAGTERLMVPFGNHSRGTKFIDLSHLAVEKLTDTIDGICGQIPGFYYGRLDVRYRNWDDLCSGKNFCIIELNGSGSEPTHIYDPKHSLLFGWKEIIRHLDLLYNISSINHKSGIHYMSFKEGVQMFRDNSRHIRLLYSKA